MLARINPGMMNQLNPQDNFATGAYSFTNMPTATDAVAGTWSSWVTILSSVTNDIAGFEIQHQNANTANTNSAALFEVRYTISTFSMTVVETCPIGGLTTQRTLFFPIFIPAGASVEWRIKSVQTSFNHTFSFQFFPMCDVFGTWVRPFTGCFCTGIDAVTTLGGPVVTGGNSTWGSVTSIGTAAQDTFAVRCIPHLITGTIGTATSLWARISVGGVIHQQVRAATATSEVVNSNAGVMPVATYIPSGATINCEVWHNTASATSISYTAQCFYGPL